MEISESNRYAEYLHINDLSTLTLVNIYFQNVLFSTYLFNYLEFAPEGYVHPKTDSELFLRWCLKHGIRLTGLSFYFGSSFTPPTLCLRNANRLLLLLTEYLNFNKNGEDLISLCIACEFTRDFGTRWFREEIMSLFKHIFAKCPNLIGLYIDWLELDFTLTERDIITIINSEEYKKQLRLRDFVFFEFCPFLRNQRTLDAFVQSLVDKFGEHGICDLRLYSARHEFFEDQHTHQLLKVFEQKNMFRFSVLGRRSNGYCPMKEGTRLLLSECLGVYICCIHIYERFS